MRNLYQNRPKVKYEKKDNFKPQSCTILQNKKKRITTTVKWNMIETSMKNITCLDHKRLYKHVKYRQRYWCVIIAKDSRSNLSTKIF